MIYPLLFWEFFKIGLFAVGGGMATLPFLQRLGEKTGWFTQALITDMIAISESTPGPIGINMATYVGYQVAGIWGGIVATMGEILPALIIVTIVARSLNKFRNSPIVDAAFHGLRPAVTALIASACLDVMQVALLKSGGGNLLAMIDWVKVAFLLVAFFLVRKYKKSPIIYIAVSAAIGIAVVIFAPFGYTLIG